MNSLLTAAKVVKKVKTDVTQAKGRIAGSRPRQLCSVSARGHSARMGPVMIINPETASSKCDGLSSASRPSSKPKVSCQIRSATPPAAKMKNPARESP